jgi:hypothetical protein
VVLLKKGMLLAALCFLIILSSSAFAAVDFTATTSQATVDTFACEQKTIPVAVTNTGDITASYAVFFDGDAKKWVSPVETFTLVPGASKEIELALDIPCRAFGDYSLGTIIATADVEKELVQNISVSKAINIGLSPVIWKQSINPCETAQFEIELANLGTFTEQYSLAISSPLKNTTLDNSAVELAAGQNKTIAVKATPENCLQHGNYTLTLSAETNKTGLFAEIDLSLEINSAGIAELTGPDKLEIDYSGGNATFELANKGDAKIDYVLSVEPVESNASFADLEARIVTIKAGEKANFEVLFNPDNETIAGIYNFNLTATTDSGREYSKNFAVELSKPAAPSQWKSKIISVLAPVGHFFSTIFGFVKHNLKYFGFGLLAIIVLAALIWLFVKFYKKVGRKKRGETEKRQKSRKSRYLFITIGVILAIVALLFAFVNSPQGYTKGIPDQVWNENLAHKLDLNKYFKDPDKDALEFAYTELEHINVEIKDGIATLTPESGWTGTETVVFTADDGNGGIVDSNEFKLSVLPSLQILPASVQAYLGAKSGYFIGGLIVLILVLVYLGLERFVFR